MIDFGNQRPVKAHIAQNEMNTINRRQRQDSGMV